MAGRSAPSPSTIAAPAGHRIPRRRWLAPTPRGDSPTVSSCGCPRLGAARLSCCAPPRPTPGLRPRHRFPASRSNGRSALDAGRYCEAVATGVPGRDRAGRGDPGTSRVGKAASGSFDPTAGARGVAPGSPPSRCSWWWTARWPTRPAGSPCTDTAPAPRRQRGARITPVDAWASSWRLAATACCGAPPRAGVRELAAMKARACRRARTVWSRARCWPVAPRFGEQLDTLRVDRSGWAGSCGPT